MSRNIRVVPAILTDNPAALENMVRQVETYTKYAQFDIMDGQFVPSHSITWEHIASLPTKLTWEAHLMVMRPENYLQGFLQAGAKKVVFHYEATSSPQKVINLARTLGLGVGLAVNPETTLESFLPIVDEVDSVLFLTVNPGYYGSKFIPEVMDKVKELRSVRPEIEIGVDGGIKEANITSIARAGVDVIYVGSAISLQPDPGESYRRLLALAKQG